jgi:hypothetical protein
MLKAGIDLFPGAIAKISSSARLEINLRIGENG